MPDIVTGCWLNCIDHGQWTL